jgi:hypothetical protein
MEKLTLKNSFNRHLSFGVVYAVLIILILPCKLHGQEKTVAVLNEIQKRQSVIMTINTNFDAALNTDYKFKDKGNIYEKGVIRDITQARLHLSVPVLTDKRFRISLGAHYNFHHLNFESKETPTDGLRLNMGSEHHTWSISTNAFFYTKLFNRSIIGNANIMAECSENGFEKITGIIVGVMQIKQTQSTSIGVGLIALVNTTSPFPIFPIFTYSHKFNKRLSVDVMPPQFHFRYLFSEGNKLSAGMSIDGEHFYVRPQNELLPEVCLYSKSLMKPELVYERKVGKYLNITMKVGASIVMANRLYEKNGSKKYIEISQPVSGFFNIGFSYSIFK